jgi:hypothetical protein
VVISLVGRRGRRSLLKGTKVQKVYSPLSQGQCQPGVLFRSSKACNGISGQEFPFTELGLAGSLWGNTLLKGEVQLGDFLDTHKGKVLDLRPVVVGAHPSVLNRHTIGL